MTAKLKKTINGLYHVHLRNFKSEHPLDHITAQKHAKRLTKLYGAGTGAISQRHTHNEEPTINVEEVEDKCHNIIGNLLAHAQIIRIQYQSIDDGLIDPNLVEAMIGPSRSSTIFNDFKELRATSANAETNYYREFFFDHTDDALLLCKYLKKYYSVNDLQRQIPLPQQETISGRGTGSISQRHSDEEKTIDIEKSSKTCELLIKKLRQIASNIRDDNMLMDLNTDANRERALSRKILNVWRTLKDLSQHTQTNWYHEFTVRYSDDDATLREFIGWYYDPLFLNQTLPNPVISGRGTGASILSADDETTLDLNKNSIECKKLVKEIVRWSKYLQVLTDPIQREEEDEEELAETIYEEFRKLRTLSSDTSEDYYTELHRDYPQDVERVRTFLNRFYGEGWILHVLPMPTISGGGAAASAESARLGFPLTIDDRCRKLVAYIKVMIAIIRVSHIEGNTDIPKEHVKNLRDAYTTLKQINGQASIDFLQKFIDEDKDSIDLLHELLADPKYDETGSGLIKGGSLTVNTTVDCLHFLQQLYDHHKDRSGTHFVETVFRDPIMIAHIIHAMSVLQQCENNPSFEGYYDDYGRLCMQTFNDGVMYGITLDHILSRPRPRRRRSVVIDEGAGLKVEKSNECGHIREEGSGLLFRTDGVLAPSMRNKLREYADTIVKEITIIRTPIQSGIKRAINFFTNGKFSKVIKDLGYDDVFHLAMVINGTVQIDKQHIVTIGKPYQTKESQTIKISPPKQQITVEELMHNTKSYMGDHKYTSYDAFKNNCQDFIMGILNGNHMNSKPVTTFVKQDTGAILRRTPSLVAHAVKVVTDAAQIGNHLIEGSGNLDHLTPPEFRNRMKTAIDIPNDRERFRVIAEIYQDLIRVLSGINASEFGGEDQKREHIARKDRELDNFINGALRK